MNPVTIEAGLQIIAELIQLIQAAQKNGTPIPAADFATVVGARNAALSKLDTDIKNAP